MIFATPGAASSGRPWQAEDVHSRPHLAQPATKMGGREGTDAPPVACSSIFDDDPLHDFHRSSQGSWVGSSVASRDGAACPQGETLFQAPCWIEQWLMPDLPGTSWGQPGFGAGKGKVGAKRRAGALPGGGPGLALAELGYALLAKSLLHLIVAPPAAGRPDVLAKTRS